MSQSDDDDKGSDMQDDEVDQILFEEETKIQKYQQQFKPSVNLYVPLEAF